MTLAPFRNAPPIFAAICLLFSSARGETPTTLPADFVPVKIKLPRIPYGSFILKLPPDTPKPSGKPRPPFMAPPGTINLALDRLVTSSDTQPAVGVLGQITDGEKEAKDGQWVELGPGLQWVQIDLGAPCDIYGICLWHYHARPRRYNDVVVQVSDDQQFIRDIRTVFNNDRDNSSGLRNGDDEPYIETFEGRLIDTRGKQFKGIRARYVRCYSRGASDDDQNHYSEIEVYGEPAR